MTGFQICLLALVVGGMGPSVAIAGRGTATDRLVGTSLVSTIAVVVFLLVAQVAGESYELIVPFVMAPMSFAGVLVFTRLLATRRRTS